MQDQHATVFDHMQSVAVMAACVALMWSHSFTVAGEVFGALEACALVAFAWHRWQLARLRRRSLPPGTPA